MRIVIDLQSCQTESRYRGIGRYSLALAEALSRNAENHEIWLILSDRFPDSIDEIKEHFRDRIPRERIIALAVPEGVAEIKAGGSWRVRAAEMVREQFVVSLNPDVVLVTSLFEGFVDDAVTSVPEESSGYSFKTAVILYDLIPFSDQEKYFDSDKYKNFYLRKLESLKRADFLFSISEFSRQEGLRLLDLPPERIVNIGTAADPCFCPGTVPDTERLKLFSRLSIDKPFVLYAPGGFDPRKNVEGLLNAFGLLPVELRKKYQLVIASRIDSWTESGYRKAAAKSGLDKKSLIFTGYLSNEELIVLYRSCSLFVFPSLMEGFGLPALEAMSCGAPVVGSNTTSVPEVIGLDEAMFDPGDSEEMARIIERSLMDLSFRDLLQDNGKNRSGVFSWDNVSGTFFQHLEEFCTGSVRGTKEDFSASRIIHFLSGIVAHASRKDAVSLANSIAVNELTIGRMIDAIEMGESIRIEGPFDSTYSLSVLNRETALALKSAGYDVSLHSTEGPGDFLPDQLFLNQHPEINELYQKSLTGNSSKIVSRNLYPPRVSEMYAPLKTLHHFAWEETGFPGKWSENFNLNLDGITCLSQHVKKVLIDNGVTVPLYTSGCGVDHWERITPDCRLKIPGKKYKILHVSSCFPRKGAELLLESYGDAFTDTDDVSLIIKTFHNPHNDIQQIYDQLRCENNHYPDVHIIYDDLSDGQLKYLYSNCDLFVLPTRAEGFGIPIAEAMLSGLPVIVTGWGGQMDFCSPENCWLIDYTFEYAQTHFDLFDSVWATPRRDHLAELIREVYSTEICDINKKIGNARYLLMQYFTWDNAVKRYIRSCNSFIKNDLSRTSVEIGWVTPWNVPCGIAMYMKHLLSPISDMNHVIFASCSNDEKGSVSNNVIPCWSSGCDDSLERLEQCIFDSGINVIVIQFNFGFYNFESLNSLVETLSRAGKVVVVEMHATRNPINRTDLNLKHIRKALSFADRILVHSVSDLNRLKDIGLTDNVSIFPLGMPVFDFNIPEVTTDNKEFIISTYGFFLPHKGFLDLLHAFHGILKGIPDTKLRMVNARYPAVESDQAIEEAEKLIKELNLDENVEMITDFLEERESLGYLAKSDLIVLPYKDNGESASAAVRMALVLDVPVAVTPATIFENVRPAVFELSGFDIESIQNSLFSLVRSIKSDDNAVKKKMKRAKMWKEDHSFSVLSIKYKNILKALVLQKCDRDVFPE